MKLAPLSFSSGLRRPTIATFAPWFSNAMAKARPMPAVPPTTRTERVLRVWDSSCACNGTKGLFEGHKKSNILFLSG